MHFTAILWREDDIVVALCPELDVASQGSSIEEAKENLTEAVELFLEVAPKEEARARFRESSFVTTLEVKVG